MLFNIYETDFKDKTINKKINNHLYVRLLLNINVQLDKVKP